MARFGSRIVARFGSRIIARLGSRAFVLAISVTVGLTLADGIVGGVVGGSVGGTLDRDGDGRVGGVVQTAVAVHVTVVSDGDREPGLGERGVDGAGDAEDRVTRGVLIERRDQSVGQVRGDRVERHRILEALERPVGIVDRQRHIDLVACLRGDGGLVDRHRKEDQQRLGARVGLRRGLFGRGHDRQSEITGERLGRRSLQHAGGLVRCE